MVMSVQEQQMYNALQHDLLEARRAVQQFAQPRAANIDPDLVATFNSLHAAIGQIEGRMNDLAAGKAKLVNGEKLPLTDKQKKKKARRKKKEAAMGDMVMSMATAQLGKSNPAIALLAQGMRGGKDARKNAANALMGLVAPGNPSLSIVQNMMALMDDDKDDDDDDKDDDDDDDTDD